MTTIIILIQAILDTINSDQRLNYTSSDEIRKKFIYESKGDGISRSYIFGYEKDNPSYEFLKKNIFLEETLSSFTVQETIYTRNLESSKQFFLDKLKLMETSEIENIYRKITQNFLFNIYTISNDIDVYVAFETMNNRGKPLSHLELLKNRLIYLSTKFHEQETEKDFLRYTINEAWKSVYHYLGKNKDKPLDDDDFLYNHFIIYYEDIEYSEKTIRSYRKNYKEILLEQVFIAKNIYTDREQPESFKVTSIQDVNNYVRSLKNSVETWYQLLNPQDSEFSDDVKFWLEKLNRLEILRYAPLIMFFFQTVKQDNLRKQLLESIEKFDFLNYHLLGVKSSVISEALIEIQVSDEINPIILVLQLRDKKITPENIIKKIKKSSSILSEGTKKREVSNLLDELRRLNNLKEFEKSKVWDQILYKQISSKFRKKGFYKWTGIQYFLYEYELSLKESSKTHRDKIKWDEYLEDSEDYYTIEHIYPQTAQAACWKKEYSKYSSKEKEALCQSLGNLVPLSRPKNSSLSNKCFSEKKEKNESSIGFKYGSYSEIEIAKHEKWTAKEIMERGLKLLSFMENRWNINLGNTQEKILMLNLEFVPEKENIDIEGLK